MKGKVPRALAGAILLLITLPGWPEDAKHSGPPSIWVVSSPYPFQAGTERTFDELYHGPWKTTVDLVLYARPRSRQVVGNVRAGTVVEAVVAETIVVHPLRFVAPGDSRVFLSGDEKGVKMATMHKGDVFWVLDSGDEGGFGVWWHCSVVGWDSTDPSNNGLRRLELLGKNQEGWVKVRDGKTGLSGWFNDAQNRGANLVPAQATTKVTG
jgi:hypothetical protein